MVLLTPYDAIASLVCRIAHREREEEVFVVFPQECENLLFFLYYYYLCPVQDLVGWRRLNT